MAPVLYLVIALTVVVKLLDRFAADKQPIWLLTSRYVTAMVLLGLLMVLVLASWQGMSGVISSLLSIVPLIVVGVPLLRNRQLKRHFALAGVLFGVAGAMFGIAFSSLGTFLHGDAHPALKLATTAFGAASIVLIMPPRIPLAPPVKNASRKLAIALPLLAILGWGALSIHITTSARTIFPEGQTVCLRAPTGSQARHAFGIPPGEFRATDWRGMTRPWLLAGTKRAGWSHHWSFFEFKFVANETGSFTMLTPGMKSPTTPAC